MCKLTPKEVAAGLIFFLFHCNNMCKLTPKEVAARLQPLLVLAYTYFLTKTIGANISPLIDIKHNYLLLLQLFHRT